ncbi:hypothetical protein NWI01_14520 [Nitrobacter winogradskyi]|uniref:Uncharacterized protein n=1 Tax=Nitrobacter winogradskyi TaxID=913 RepID=A0A4Y3WBY8_NITWI|nr:hypothetical protein NWI01_14520 [Nitrobacter winogradskyi]
MAAFGVVVGLQSTCIPARSDELRGGGAAVEDNQFRLALLIKNVAGHARDGFTIQVSEVSAEKAEVSADTQVSETSAEKAEAPADTQVNEVSAEKEEVPAERERDHSARSLNEMLAWFLKGAALLTAMVLFYKGLKWWVLRNRESE